MHGNYLNHVSIATHIEGWHYTNSTTPHVLGPSEAYMNWRNASLFPIGLRQIALNWHWKMEALLWLNDRMWNYGTNVFDWQ